jgi:hypothetical protein
MEWIVQQSWHSGGIVTNGMSALGIAQFAVAVLRSPHHAGMWIDWASPSGTSPSHPLYLSFISISFPACLPLPRAPRSACNLSLTHATVFTQLSFPQGCFRQHDITGWLTATARDAADIMLVSHCSPIRLLQYIPRDALPCSLCSRTITTTRLGGRLRCCPPCLASACQLSSRADTSTSWSRSHIPTFPPSFPPNLHTSTDVSLSNCSALKHPHPRAQCQAGKPWAPTAVSYSEFPATTLDLPLTAALQDSSLTLTTLACRLIHKLTGSTG